MLWQAELLDDAYLFALQLPGRFTELLQRQFEVQDVSRLDADKLAADKVDGQAIAASDQHLQVGLIAVERAFAVLADMTLRGLPAYLPPVTGAAAPKLLGKLSFP